MPTTIAVWESTLRPRFIEARFFERELFEKERSGKEFLGERVCLNSVTTGKNFCTTGDEFFWITHIPDS
jgi:hypothetical protein